MAVTAPSEVSLAEAAVEPAAAGPAPTVVTKAPVTSAKVVPVRRAARFTRTKMLTIASLHASMNRIGRKDRRMTRADLDGTQHRSKESRDLPGVAFGR